MLNSGICNWSGVLGHYVVDHIFRNGAGKSASGFIRGHGYYKNAVRENAPWKMQLTMMALTVRACDYIVREYAKKLG